MKTAHLYRWRVLVRGRWRSTRHHCTEDEIRATEDVEVFEPIEDTLQALQLSETEEERAAVILGHRTPRP